MLKSTSIVIKMVSVKSSWEWRLLELGSSPPVEGKPNPGVRWGRVLVLGTLLLFLQRQPLPLPLALHQPLPLPLALRLEGPGGEDREPSLETRGGGWLGSSQASSSLRGGRPSQPVSDRTCPKDTGCGHWLRATYQGGGHRLLLPRPPLPRPLPLGRLEYLI